MALCSYIEKRRLTYYFGCVCWSESVICASHIEVRLAAGRRAVIEGEGASSSVAGGS